MNEYVKLVLAAAALGACSAPREAEPAPNAGVTPAAAPAAPAQAPAAPAAAQQPASPRDTARATIGAAQVMVDYGRPYMRGRTIMGGLVPYGQVWRTGANQATHLVTSAPLQVAGTALPAGTYTLYSLPAEAGWQLIVNRQTGQWGTQYDAGQDVARIPLRMSRLATPVEQFTIRIEPQSDGSGVLAMEWENTRAEASFRAAGR